MHGCHTIVPRPLILRPDFVTAGLVSFGATTVSCSTLLRQKSISFKTLPLLVQNIVSKLSHGFQGLIIKQEN